MAQRVQLSLGVPTFHFKVLVFILVVLLLLQLSAKHTEEADNDSLGT